MTYFVDDILKKALIGKKINVWVSAINPTAFGANVDYARTCELDYTILTKEIQSIEIHPTMDVDSIELLFTDNTSLIMAINTTSSVEFVD